MFFEKGFTLIELLITIGIIAILSGIILFSITQYVNRSKDASIAGNLSVLIPAGEVYYDHNNGNGYAGFCGSSSLSNANSSVSLRADNPCKDNNGNPAICCKESTNAWAACVYEFVNSDRAFCVDSRGVKKEICNSDCPSYINNNFSCPELKSGC